MRRLLGVFVLSAITRVAPLDGQEQRATAAGSTLIAGSATFSRTSRGDGDVLATWALAPAVQYFFWNKVALGSELAFTRSSQGDYASTSWAVGPGARWYLASVGAWTQPYIGATYQRGRAALDVVSGNSPGGRQRRHFTNSSVTAVAGVARLLNAHVALAAEGFWNATDVPLFSNDGVSSETATVLGLRFGIQTFVGPGRR